MQLLLLQFVDPRLSSPTPHFSNRLGVLSAGLKEAGFSVAIEPLAGYQDARLHQVVIGHRPSYVLVDLSPHSITPARRAIAEIAGRFSLPVAVLGPHATCRPTDAISMPGVTALLLGECEQTAVELCRAVRHGADPAGIDGLWLNTESGLVKGPLRPLVEDLDSLPCADRALFDYQGIVDETGEASFTASRGCPNWCGHCVNDWYMSLYEGRGQFVRRRSVTHLLGEVQSVLDAYRGARQVAFCDHAFASDLDWMRQFAELYPSRCMLPFRCHVQLDRVTPELPGLLAKARCRQVRANIGSGSKFIREEVLSMHLGNEQIVQACQLLKEAGLSLQLDVSVGNPYETQITIDDTLALLRKIRPDQVHPGVYHPTPGTRAAELCSENGWISGRSEESFWHGRSVLDMPSMPAEKIDATARRFETLLKRRPRRSLSQVLGKALWTR